MANNKNQHFVPQFYLRNFSAHPELRSVNLFNIALSRAISQASIRNQCSRDYWHGKHDSILEESVKRIESIGASAIRECILTNRIHQLRTLKTFMMFQLGRTVFSAEAFAEARNKIHQLTYGQPAKQKDLEPMPNINAYMMISPIILDMAACLVANNTKIDFVTSDNPVALSNWWFRHIYRQRPGSGIGLAQAGLEICFPLSPRHQLILYDRNIWSVPKANAIGTTYLRKEGDVFALNERQVLNAQHNVYFASMESAPHVAELSSECSGRRKAEKVRVHEFVQSVSHAEKFVRPGAPDAAPKIREKFLITEANEIEPQRRVTLFSKRFKPRFFQHPSAVGALRDFAWIQIVEDFRNQLKKGKLNFTDLEQYAAEHPLIHHVGAWKDEYWECISPAEPTRC